MKKKKLVKIVRELDEVLSDVLDDIGELDQENELLQRQVDELLDRLKNLEAVKLPRTFIPPPGIPWPSDLNRPWVTYNINADGVSAPEDVTQQQRLGSSKVQ